MKAYASIILAFCCLWIAWAWMFGTYLMTGPKAVHDTGRFWLESIQPAGLMIGVMSVAFLVDDEGEDVWW